MCPRTVKEMGKSSPALDIGVTAPVRRCLVLALAEWYFSDLLLNLRMQRFDTISDQNRDFLGEYQGAWSLLQVDQGMAW